MNQTTEPHDRYVYNYVNFYVSTLTFFREAVTYAEGILHSSIDDIQSNSALAVLFDDRDKRELPAFVILRELQWSREWLTDLLEKLSDDERRFGDTEVSIDHYRVRVIKSAALLFIQHLKAQRNSVSTRPNFPQHILQSIDRKITEKEELILKGVFQAASTIPMLADELLLAQDLQDDAGIPAEMHATDLSRVQRPRPVVLESIEIIDEALRHRCLDLLAQFRHDGDESRLDTVVSEATRILEDRLRKRSRADATCVGVNLATFAFGKSVQRLRLSDVEAEQEGAHQLFRGLFAFIRNHVGHHLVENLSPQRTLQIVGMVDYLLYLIDEAEVGPQAVMSQPSGPTSSEITGH